MGHLPLSVVVAAGGGADQFRECLVSLRSSLTARDEVVCVMPADRADLRAEVAGRTWLTTLVADPADPAGRWASGLAAGTHPVVVLLDGDVILTAHWLEPLAAAFAEPDVVAAGPRCHRSFGPQGVDVPAGTMDTVAGFRTYARRWRQEHRGRAEPVDRLGPVCVAVRREALDRAGGPGPGLPYEELRAQGRLVLVDSVLVGHFGSPACALRAVPSGPRPLLSACLIVKDEADVLASCLTAVRDFVDEIVVYDTGSTDGTRELARELGARVIEGYWNDHFADARNRALEHCRGEWVLQVDADEVATGAPDRVRQRLSAATEQVFLVVLENEGGDGGTAAPMSFVYSRLFRRDLGRYVRRIHEQVVDRVTGQGLAGRQMDDLVLRHSGYTSMRGLIKDKDARNIRLAQLAADGPEADAVALVGLARSELGAGEVERAIETCRRGLALDSTNRIRTSLLDVLIGALVHTGRFAEANSALGELRRLPVSPVTADGLEAQLRFAEGDLGRALAIVEAFPETVTDELMRVVGRGRLADLEARCLAGLGRHHEAAELVRRSLAAGELVLPLTELADLLAAGGTGIAELATLLPRRSLRGLLHAVNRAPDALADELLDALWTRYPGERMVLAVAARIGQGLPVLRALDWSARLRGHGLAAQCTLLALAGNHRRTPRERSMAAAIAVEMFADERAMPLLAEALDAVPDEENVAVLAELRALAPGVAAAVSPIGA